MGTLEGRLGMSGTREGWSLTLMTWLSGKTSGELRMRMVSLVVNRKDAVARHAEVQLGTRAGQQQRGSTLEADGLSPGWLRQNSSHI